MQRDTIQQIINFYHRQKRMPSYSEMMELFGFKSKNAVYRLVQKMLDAGLVAKDHIGRLLPTAQFTELPMAGFVKAGMPSSVDELTESVDFNSLLIRKRAETFILEVDGDSMIDAHIEPGDMVVVERSGTARDGDIVIALVDGENTMKYFRKDKEGRIYLEPANRKYHNIYPEHDLEITGIVKGVVRRY